MKLKPNHVVIPLITIGIALLGSYFTELGMDWYKETLVKPGLTPPDYVFGIAWSTIYTLAAISAIIAWNKSKKDHIPKIIFAINAALNIFWSFLFFTLQNPTLAFVEMLFLDFSLLALVAITWRCCRLASLLLMPYAVWICFATYLTYAIIILN